MDSLLPKSAVEFDPRHPPALSSQASLLAPIWQWAPNWQCLMLGMGLSPGEQRRVFKRPAKTRHLSAYALHQALMTVAGEENKVSRRVDRLLRHRFQRTIDATASLPPGEFLAFWRRDWQGDQGLALFYVAAARRDLDEETRREIYGCVHMAGHVAAVDLLAAWQEAGRQRQANVRLARKVRQLRDEMRRQARQRSQKAQVQAKVAGKGAVRQLVSGPAPPQHPAPKDALQQANERLQCELRHLEREKRQLEIRYFELQAQNGELAREVRELMAQAAAVFACSGSCQADCPNAGPVAPACPRRVLIVGGMTKLHHLYRDLVAAAGGQLDYHDGYLRQGGDNLQARIGRSDLVICPVNCNSHNACKRVKGICKRLDKPLHLLPTASLSAITAALSGDPGVVTRSTDPSSKGTDP